MHWAVTSFADTVVGLHEGKEVRLLDWSKDYLLSHSPAPIETFLASLANYCTAFRSDLSLLLSVQDEVEAAAKAHQKQAEQNERDVGFISSRTATVRGAIASLGNMAIAEDMDFSNMFEAIDVRTVALLVSRCALVRLMHEFQTFLRCCRGLADRQEWIHRQDGAPRSFVGTVATGCQR